MNGLRQALDVGELRLVFPLTVLIAASVASLVPLSLALSEALKQGAVGFVLLQASFGVGALVGGLLTSLLKTSRRGILIFIAGLGLGASIMLAGASSVIWITMIFFAGAGLCNLVFLIPIVELIRDVTDAQNRARVYAARFTIIQLGVLLGVIYAAIIVTQVPSASPQLALFFTGAVIALVSAIFGAAPTMRRI